MDENDGLRHKFSRKFHLLTNSTWQNEVFDAGQVYYLLNQLYAELGKVKGSKGQAAERPFPLEVISCISFQGNTYRFPATGASSLLLLKLTFVLFIPTCCHGTLGTTQKQTPHPHPPIHRSVTPLLRYHGLMWGITTSCNLQNLKF